MKGGSVFLEVKKVSEVMAQAVSAGMAGAGEGAKQELRKQLRATSTRFASGRAVNAIRSAVYPSPPRYSGNAAFTVFAAGDSADRFLSAFAKGPLIVPKRERALAIPLHNLRQGRDYGQNRTETFRGPKDPFWGGKLIYLPAHNAPPGTIGYLCLPRERGVGRGRRRIKRLPGVKALAPDLARELTPVFVLVSAAHMPRLLSFDETMVRWANRIPSLIRDAADMLYR